MLSTTFKEKGLCVSTQVLCTPVNVFKIRQVFEALGDVKSHLSQRLSIHVLCLFTALSNQVTTRQQVCLQITCIHPVQSIQITAQVVDVLLNFINK